MTQEELNLRIRRNHALPKNIKAQLEKSSLEYLRKIAAMDPDDIIARTKKLMATDSYKSEIESDYYADQMAWLVDYTDGDLYEIETCLQVHRLFSKIGVEIKLDQAHYVWDYVSDNACAQWLCKGDDIECWSAILADFIFNQPKNIEEGIFRNESNS